MTGDEVYGPNPISTLRRRGLFRIINAMRQSPEVFISDTTLQDGEQMPGVAFSLGVKVQIATALERAGIHSIEAGFAAAGTDEVRSIRAVAVAVDSPVVMSLARATVSDIDCAAAALADRPRHKRVLVCSWPPVPLIGMPNWG